MALKFDRQQKLADEDNDPALVCTCPTVNVKVLNRGIMTTKLRIFAIQTSTQQHKQNETLHHLVAM